jgi:hypothetical protein
MKKKKQVVAIVSVILAGIIITLLLFYFMHKNNNPEISSNSNKTYCKPDQRGAQFCYELYAPVCGWYNQTVKCIKYPCGADYANNCFACSDVNVEYYSEGECPT